MDRDFEPKILGFLCNWCAYAGADLAGVSRLQYAPNLRVIRVMCSGRVDPVFILDAFQKGMDGVLVGGCHPGDCHYLMGNRHAENMARMTGKVLEEIGISGERLHLAWVSASEGPQFAEAVNGFVSRLKGLGPLGAGGDPGGLRLGLEAAKAAVSGEKLRWLLGREMELLTVGNVYGEVYTRHEMDRAYEAVIYDEVVTNRIMLLLGDEALSVREVAGRLELPLPDVLRRISTLRKREMVELEGIRDTSPLYRARG